MNLNRTEQFWALVGGRKMLVAASTGFLACVLVFFEKIDPIAWRDVILGTVGIFIAGNVTEAIKAPKPKVKKDA